MEMKSLMRLACLGAVAMAFVACGMECGRFGYDYGSTAKSGGFIV